jgi:hypothetical protein
VAGAAFVFLLRDAVFGEFACCDLSPLDTLAFVSCFGNSKVSSAGSPNSDYPLMIQAEDYQKKSSLFPKSQANTCL